jgi:hypothetical protein
LGQQIKKKHQHQQPKDRDISVVDLMRLNLVWALFNNSDW